jgi:hypothetical protein
VVIATLLGVSEGGDLTLPVDAEAGDELDGRWRIER